jgi:3-phenylpropionate/cinnamic acid dioxygenase small subunit
MTPAETREAIADLVAEYAHRLDEDRLEDWLDLFDETCSYRIVPRENHDLGLPLPLMLCENKAMLQDRVLSLRNANIYNIHRDRHVVGSLLVRPADDGLWSLRASFAVYQTDSEGRTALFVAGSYRDTLIVSGDRPLFRDKLVLLDTAAIPTLLATPL